MPAAGRAHSATVNVIAVPRGERILRSEESSPLVQDGSCDRPTRRLQGARKISCDRRLGCQRQRALRDWAFSACDTSTVPLIVFLGGSTRHEICRCSCGVTLLDCVAAHTGASLAMSTRDMPNCECPRCASANTIRTEHTLDREAWHCYACHRSFEVMSPADAPQHQRGAADRRRARSAPKRNG